MRPCGSPCHRIQQGWCLARACGFSIGGETVKDGDAGGSIKGYLNLPFWDNKAALRVSGVQSIIPGYIDNPQLGEADVSCVFVSHDRYFTRTAATRFIEIRRGKLVEVEDPDEFFDAQA